MPSDRLLTILRELRDAERSEVTTPWCVVAAQVTQLDGAGIGLFTSHATTLLCASTPQVRTLFELEVTVGEGPCHSVRTSGDVVNEPALAADSWRRWPSFAPLAGDTGAGALFGFPLRLGAVHLGALVLTRDAPGELTGDQSTDGHLLASVLSRTILATQAGAPAAEIAHELDDNASFDFVVHQATGMVSVQARVPITDALLLVRAHAYAQGDTAAAVARQIVGRHLMYDPQRAEWTTKGPPHGSVG